MRHSGVPLLFFLLMLPHRDAIKRIGEAVKQQGVQRNTVASVAQMSKDRGQRQSLVLLSKEFAYLVPKFEDFAPDCWWMSVFLLVVRLLQTSLMVLFPAQHIQAAFSSSISLVAIFVERELSPYRRPSDNRTAICARWLVFLWSFGLLLRLVHVLGSFPSVFVGLVLVIATVTVGVDSLRIAIKDTKHDLKMRRQRKGNPTSSEEPVLLDTTVQHSTLEMQEHDVEPPRDASETSLGAPHSARRLPQEEKSEEPGGLKESDSMESASWSWRLLDATLCISENEREGKAPEPAKLGLGASATDLDAKVERLVAQHEEALAVKDRSHAAELAMKDESFAMKDEALKTSHAAELAMKDEALRSHAAELAMKDEALAEKDREIARLQS